MSNFTSASGEASVSGPNPHPAKRKRNLPGNPDPDAEVIALSPNTLMATNRFVCEICGKGFQRDQNLQLHRRGHNLPWKLKQRSGKEARKKAYVCPEATCVHHEPSRALGDLTGIKKHFSRKHGEKKWRCDKCSKKYAVQSDWKAHSKVCGTREYRCDCGTMFSRRDSFITHRAFCDALAEENARAAVSSTVSSAVPSSNQSDPHFAVPSWLAACNHPQLDLPSQSSTHSSAPAPPSTLDELTKKMEPPFAFPSWLSACDDVRADFPTAPPQGNGSPHMSATALLQKAAQMGATMSRPSSSYGLGLSSPFHQHGGAINVHDLMVSSLPLAASGLDQGASFDVNFEGLAKEGGNHDDLTRDFLGLSAFSHRDLINLAGLETCISTSSFETQDKKPWHLD